MREEGGEGRGGEGEGGGGGGGGGDDDKESFTKRIVEEGKGVVAAVVEDGNATGRAKCFLTYTLWLHQEHGELLDDKKGEDDVVELILSRDLRGGTTSVSSPLPIGLIGVVATMRAGERAIVHLPPHLAYGERGSFSFPSVPPHARVVYDIILLGFEPLALGGYRRDMTFERRIEAAIHHKTKGGELFRAGDIKLARYAYSCALSYFSTDVLFQLEGEHMHTANNVLSPLHSNLAACCLKQEDYHKCIYHCGQVLKENKGSTKALFRRARARLALQQTQEAEADLVLAQALAPDDREIERELCKVRRRLKEETRAEAAVYTGMFEKREQRGNRDGGHIEKGRTGNDDNGQRGSDGGENLTTTNRTWSQYFAEKLWGS